MLMIKMKPAEPGSNRTAEERAVAEFRRTAAANPSHPGASALRALADALETAAAAARGTGRACSVPGDERWN